MTAAPKNDLEQWQAMLRQAYLLRERELLEKYDRSLPFQDAMFDRWERARRLGFGEGASIYNSALVYGDVSVGRGTWIGAYVILDGSGGGIVIGSTVSIASGAHIYTHDTIHWALSGGKQPPKQKPVRVGDCCYIGSQTVVAAGVTIGSHCVVAANSFVNRDVPSHTIVGGVPAARLGTVQFENGEPQLVYDRDRGTKA